MANYRDWIDNVDIKVDYFSAFLKAWIAFNAWYNEEIPGKTDKERIENISDTTNRYKTYMNNLLNSETSEGISFRESVGGLQDKLRISSITTQEYIGFSQTISFAEIPVRNHNQHKEFDFYRYRYKCVKNKNKNEIETTILHKKNKIEIFKFNQDTYNIDILKQQSSFCELSSISQEKCLECYLALCPYKTESIFDESKTAIKIGAFNFVNDVGRISRAIITILYLLRCALAHGDVSPDETSNDVYRYAYEVLVSPLKKLK